MNSKLFPALAVAAALFAAAPARTAPVYGYVTVDGYGAAGSKLDIRVTSINNAGQAAGVYREPGILVANTLPSLHGFRYGDGVFETVLPQVSELALNEKLMAVNQINDQGNVIGLLQSVLPASDVVTARFRDGGADTVRVPDSGFTVATGLSNDDRMVGFFRDDAGNHGFLYDQTTFTRFDVPGAIHTYPMAISDSGLIAGYYEDATGHHGFRYDGTAFTSFDAPAGARPIVPVGINAAGQVAGYFVDVAGHRHGFLWTPSALTPLEMADAGDTWVTAINADGQLVGNSSGSAFFYRDGSFFPLAPPGVDPRTVRATALNNAGQIGGYFSDSAGTWGFVASPFVLQPTVRRADRIRRVVDGEVGLYRLRRGGYALAASGLRRGDEVAESTPLLKANGKPWRWKNGSRLNNNGLDPARNRLTLPQVAGKGLRTRVRPWTFDLATGKATARRQAALAVPEVAALERRFNADFNRDGLISPQYLLALQPARWKKARIRATRLGGHLAELEARGESEVVWDLLRGSDRSGNLRHRPRDGNGAAYVWLGATVDNGHGVWEWLNGSPVDPALAAWGTTAAGHAVEPNRLKFRRRRQDYLALGLEDWPRGSRDPALGEGHAGQWNDLIGSDRLPYLVEFDFVAK